MLPPGALLRFDGPPGEVVVIRIRVVVSRDGGIFCADVEPTALDLILISVVWS